MLDSFKEIAYPRRFEQSFDNEFAEWKIDLANTYMSKSCGCRLAKLLKRKKQHLPDDVQ